MAYVQGTLFYTSATYSYPTPNSPQLEDQFREPFFTRHPLAITAFFLSFALTMASHPPPAVCSTAGYQNFHSLAGFSPAQGWCSSVSLLSKKRSEEDEAKALAQRDVQCPAGSDLCNLLAELKAADREFARGVWYGILSDALEHIGDENRPLTKLLAAALECALGMNQP